MGKTLWNKIGVIFLAAVMVMSLGACGSSQTSEKKSSTQAESTTEAASGQEQVSNHEYAASNVVLPDNFDDMIYPIEALMVQDVTKKYDYYTEDSSDDEADSFWYSMAVLTSLMETESAYGDGIEQDGFYYVKDNTKDMYASALYDAYAKGNIEIPEIPENDEYVSYDDAQQMYGLKKGTVEGLSPYITSCTEDGDSYILNVQLRSTQTDQVKGKYEFTITKTSFDGEENHFAYAVENMVSSADDAFDFGKGEESSSQKTEAKEEDTSSESDSQEGTTQTQTDDGISQEDALEQAKNYMADMGAEDSDLQYSYKEKVTVGDKDYYDFSVEGEGISATDVLVSTDGEDVMSGIKNDDGTWSFDQ